MSSDIEIVSEERKDLLSHEKLVQMSSELYKAATAGNVHYLWSDVLLKSSDILVLTVPEGRQERRRRHLLSMTDEGNSCLHIAAKFGHKEFVQDVLNLCPSLVHQQNKKGDNPLHVAAKAGHLRVVKLLTDFFQWRIQSPQSSQWTESTGNRVAAKEGIPSEWPSLPIWLTQNHEGSTALHEALRNKHEDMALYLLDLDSEQVVLVVNAKNESPLYLAAEGGCVCVSKKILTAGGSNNFIGPMGQTPLHAAVFAGSIGCIKVLHESIPGLTRKQDLYGKTALYYSTQANSLKIMRLLLSLDASSAYIWDNEGLSPLLVAASIGSPASAGAILDAFPASIEYSDDRGYNALHLSVINGTMRLLRELLKRPEMMTIINEADKEGNTPLHLAIMSSYFWMANELLSTERVDLTAKNNNGQTVLDICVLEAPVLLFGRQWKLWKKLKKKGAAMGRVRPLLRLRAGGPSYISTKRADAMYDQKQLFNTVSVVAALLATITFAAPFQIPGGYTTTDHEGSHSKMGYSFLIRKPALTFFLLIDTAAFVFSMVALLLLLAATFNRKAFSRAALHYAIPFVLYAIYTAMLAFISGLYAVTSTASILMAILICIMGSTLGILHLWMLGRAFNESWFVPGLLRRQIHIHDEQMAGE